MPKRILQGVVVSDKQNKTIVVSVERRFTHPLLKKTVRTSTHYHAHDEDRAFKVGDAVSIQESRADLQAEALGRGRQGGQGLSVAFPTINYVRGPAAG